MIKHIIAIILVSIAVILAMPSAQHGLEIILSAHDWVSETLKNVFSVGQTGDLIRQLIALLAVPVLVGLIPAVVFWLTRRKWFTYFMECIWVVWLIQAAALVMLYKPPAPPT
jgi:hypothetical protein